MTEEKNGFFLQSLNFARLFLLSFKRKIKSVEEKTDHFNRTAICQAKNEVLWSLIILRFAAFFFLLIRITLKIEQWTFHFFYFQKQLYIYCNKQLTLLVVFFEIAITLN